MTDPETASEGGYTMTDQPSLSAAPLVCFCADDGSICLGDVAKCLACAERIERDPDAPCLNEPEGSC